MSLSITPENKNTLAVMNENKTSGDMTWDSSSPRTWDDPGTWDVPGELVTNETKTAITITNTSKT